MTTRRAFLETAAAILASPRSLRSAARLPIGFSTLGCPAWTWKQILDFAQTHDFAAVELRGIQKNMDLTLAPDLSREGGRIEESKRELRERLDLPPHGDLARAGEHVTPVLAIGPRRHRVFQVRMPDVAAELADGVFRLLLARHERMVRVPQQGDRGRGRLLEQREQRGGVGEIAV